MRLPFREMLSEDIIGFSEVDDIQDFLNQDISLVEEDIECVDDSQFKESKFRPEEVIFFDGTARLDYLARTKSSVIGFMTFALGHVRACLGKPIELSKSAKFKIVRKVIIPQNILKSNNLDYNKIIFSKEVAYDICKYPTNIPRVSDLWNDVVLSEIMPDLELHYVEDNILEPHYVGDKIIKTLVNGTILVKDGRIDKLFSPKRSIFGHVETFDIPKRSIFGHVKTFNIPKRILDDPNLREGGLRSRVYKLRGNNSYNVYSCYINLNSSRRSRLIKGGVFSYSRVDIASERVDDDLVDRFNFISKYLVELTSVFSDSARFPQNIPIVERLENFLRKLSGDRSIIKHIIAEKISLNEVIDFS
ncbi:MAG: hypothetical protein ABDH28_07915 [Brevinematia bacterium]